MRAASTTSIPPPSAFGASTGATGRRPSPRSRSDARAPRRESPMRTRAAFVLGMFILLAAIAHGGIYSAGHDFVVNRFTGQFEFVPAEDDEEQTPIEAARALTARRAGARVDHLVRSGARWRAIRVGR